MKQPDFIIIPTQLLSDSSLRPADRILFGYIYWMTKLALMKCVASNATLATLTGFSERGVQVSLERLEKQGYVRRIYAGNGATHRLEIECLIAFSAPRTNVRPATNKRASPARTNVHHNKIDTKKKDLITTNVVKPPAYGNPELNEMFDYWQQTTGLAITARTVPNRHAASNLFKKYGAERLKRLIDGVAAAQSDQYAPRIADFTQLQNKVDELILWGKKKSVSNKIGVIR